MPIEFSTCLERDLLYARWWGYVDFDQFQANFDAYLNDKYYVPGRPELIDHSGITELDINFDIMRTLLRTVNEQSPSIIVDTHTVIYSPNDTVFGVGRMYQLLSELAHGIRVEIFRTEEEALAALELLDTYKSFADLLEDNDFKPACRRAQGSAQETIA